MAQILLFTETNTMGYGKSAGAYRIASELRSHGYTVQVIDNYTRWGKGVLKQMIAKFVSNETLWMGFSTTFTDKREGRMKMQHVQRDIVNKMGREDIEQIFEFAKSINPKLKIVVGGVYAHFLEKYDCIDYIISGQGETSIIKLTQALAQGKDFPRHSNDKMFPYDNFITSTIDWHENDCVMPGEHLPIEIARGCIFKCKYCDFDLNGKKPGDYIKNEEVLKKELLRNHELYQPNGYLVSDDTLNDSPQKVEMIHRAFTSVPKDLINSAYGRIDLLIRHPRTLDLLYEAGFRSFFFGIETFSHKAAKFVGKGMHPDEVKRGLEWIKKTYPDILISAGIIYGLPGETLEEMRATNEYLKSSPIDHTAPTVFMLSSASIIGSNPEKFGYTKGNNIREWKRDDGVTSEQCDQIVMDAYDTWLRKKNRISWVFANRVLNCGYTLEDCHNLSMEDHNLEEIKLRARTLKQNYRDQILGL